MKRLIVLLIIVFIVCGGADAAETKQKYMTKGEVVDLLSSADVVKQKINEFVSWGTGYDLSAVNKMKLVPTFNYIAIVPKKVPPDGRTVVEIKAAVDDPGGLPSIAGVRADLTPIGRIPNMSLVDNGLFGDAKANDGVYTLQSSISPKVMEGPKEIPVTAVNKKGWMAMGSVTLDVKNKPEIREIKLNMKEVPADGKTSFSITATIDNPGGMKDIKYVFLDLSRVGMNEKIALKMAEGKNKDFSKSGVFTTAVVFPNKTPKGHYKAAIEVITSTGGYASADFDFTIK